MSITLQHARAYIKNGWSVFPLKGGTKDQPLVAWGEYAKRYATDDELVKWFGSGDSNIAIACGSLSNLSVLDADGKTGLGDVIKHKLSSPAAVFTPSNGKHLYFSYGGERNKQTSEGHEGLDSRAEGGYVCVPPSKLANGNYRWMTGSIPNNKALPSFPTGLFPMAPVAGKPMVALPASDVSIANALQGVGAGARHSTLIKLACYLVPRHHLDVVKGMLFDWNKKNTPPMEEAEIEKQLLDVSKRFEQGKYKSHYSPKKEVKEHGTLDIKTGTQASSILNAQLQGLRQTVPDLPTGFASIDAATWGITRGSICVIGARPGTGKTSFAVNVVANLCRSGKRVLFFTTEMSYEEIVEKFEASDAGVSAFSIKTRNFTAADRVALTNYIPQFEKYDLHVVNIFRPDERAVREAVERVKPDVLVFDHIQHISTGDSEYGDISKFTKFLKELAMDANIGVLVASQLHRGAAAEGVVPEIHHLKGCGTIEEEASVVILMHDEVKKDDRAVLFRIAKNRHGKCGDTTLLFKSEITKFEDMGVQVI